MSGTNIQLALLQDALDQVLADPVCAHRWHRLRAVWSGVTDHAAKQRLLNVLENLPKGPWRADVMRFTFLHGVTGSAHHTSSAAARLLDENAVDPDRLAAFMAYEWLRNIQGASGSGDFVAALASARLPEMSARVTRHLVPLLPKKLVPRVPERIQRVAVVMPYLGNLLHTPSVMALDNCAVLARLGYQTRVFSCQELVLSDVAHFRGDGNHPLLPPLDLAGWAGKCPPGTGINISDSRFSMMWRWRGMLDQLAEFDPDIVMLVGLYSHLAAVLHGVRPVVGLSTHTVPPLSPVDVWLTADKATAIQNAWGAALPSPVPHYHPYRVRHPKGPWQVSRAELDLPEDAVVWVTSGFRLESEVSGVWATRMLELLHRHPDVVWLLLGGNGNIPPALASAATGRLRAVSTRQDAVGVVGLCDIYVNPPRMGGGFSVAEAMAEGLPVVAFAGSDGGHKLGDDAVTGMEGYFALLEDLVKDAGLRADMGRRLQTRFAESLDLESSGPSLRAACELAVAHSRERLTKAVF